MNPYEHTPRSVVFAMRVILCTFTYDCADADAFVKRSINFPSRVGEYRGDEQRGVGNVAGWVHGGP